MSDDHDHDHDHDEEEDGDEGSAPERDGQGIVEAIQGAIDRGEKLQIIRRGMGHEHWNGFPLVLSDEFLLMRSLHDFTLDGFAVMRIADITEARSTEAERFFEMVLRAEGALEGLPPPRPVLLRSWRSVLESVRAHYRFAIVECEGADDADFLLGELAEVDDDEAAVFYIQVNGTREAEVSKVPLDEVTLVRFGERYIDLFGKYAIAEDRH